MASEQRIVEILKEFNNIKPIAFLQQIDVTSVGIGNVLGFLSSSDRAVSAGEISSYMNVSTARVAVLLRKMADKGLIEKNSDPQDGRKVMVSITDKGRSKLKRSRDEILLYANAIIERFGEEKILDFIESCKVIREIVDEVKVNDPDYGNTNLFE